MTDGQHGLMTHPLGDPSALQEKDALSRLWEYFLHEDNMIMQRANLFLVAQSLQLVAYTAILSAAGADGHQAERAVLTAHVIAIFGVALAAIWIYVGHRQIRYTDGLRSRLVAKVPDFAETQAAVHIRGPKAAVFIAYTIPALAGVLWVLLLVVS
ncbi:hypothetical protein [Streptomyces canus]|uniref:hypothetical protein n=1 Tax=Streptomyces canus TaxID=58343 RepID=UPI002E27E1FB|nr:hypothetical protein [Streptomyces canus]